MNQCQTQLEKSWKFEFAKKGNVCQEFECKCTQIHLTLDKFFISCNTKRFKRDISPRVDTSKSTARYDMSEDIKKKKRFVRFTNLSFLYQAS